MGREERDRGNVEMGMDFSVRPPGRFGGSDVFSIWPLFLTKKQ